MNLSAWLVSTLLAATVALTASWIFTVNLRRQAAWENAVARAILLLLLALPVAQLLAPYLPGSQWLEQQREKWSARWVYAPAVPGTEERAEPKETNGAPVFHAPGLQTVGIAYKSVLVQGVLCIWICGTAASLYRLASGLRKVRYLVNASVPWTAGVDQSTPEACARIACVRLPVMRAVEGLPSPVLVGWLRPCILVPASIAPLSKEVLLHELAHLRRGDLWWLCLGRVTCALWWFHPLAWMMTRRLERSAENVCDDLVVLWTQDAAAYAEQLMSFVPLTPGREPWWSAGAAMAGYRSELGKRISRMLEPGRAPRVTVGRGGIMSLAVGSALTLLLLVNVCASRGQTVPSNAPGSDHPVPSSEKKGEETRTEVPGQIAHAEDSDAAEDKDKAAIERKLAMVIPITAFHAEPLSDALETLRAEARRLDTAETNPANRGVNIFLKLPATVAVPPGSAAPATVPTTRADSRVTLDLSGRSLREVLDAVAGQVGMKVAVERYAVSLVPLTEMTERMVTAQFTVAPEVLGASPAPPADTTRDASNSRFDTRPWLQRKGLTFPAGSSAVYLPGSRKLVVRNTRENIERLKVLFPSGSPAR